MKKTLALLGCLFALSACSSTKPAQQATQPPMAEDDSVPEAQKVVVGDWKFEVPSSFEKKPTASDVVSFWAPGKSLTIASSYNSFDDTLENYTAQKAAVFTSEDFNMDILGVKKLSIDGTDASLIAARNKTIFVLSLSAVEHGKVFSMTCGGYMALVKESLTTCAKIFSTAKHNK